MLCEQSPCHRSPAPLPCSARTRCSWSTASCARPMPSSTVGLEVRSSRVGLDWEVGGVCRPVACMPCRVGTARHVQGSGRGIRPGMPCIQPTTPLVGTTAAAEGDDSLSTEEKALMRFQKQRMQEMAGERGLGGGPAFEGESSGEASPVPAHFGLITPCRSCSARCLHATHACATILGLQAASLRCRTRGRTCS